MTTIDKQNFLESLGFTIISVNLSSKLVVKCVLGHEFNRSFDKFYNRGVTTCPVCEQEDKIRYINRFGFTPVSVSELGSKLQLICSVGHVFNRAYTDFKSQKTKECPICDREYRIKKITELGFTPVSKDLSNDLEVMCPHSHKFKRTYDNLVNNHSILCPTCEDVKATLRLTNYTLSKIQDKVLCHQGHVINRPISKILLKKVVSCPECKVEKKMENLNMYGLEPHFSTSLGHDMQLICSNDHIFSRTYSNFIKGQTKCPICFPNISSQEVEIKEFLSQLGVEYLHSDWNTIKPQELDFYIPSAKVAIEFNGIYWHSELQGKTKNYHLDKTKVCLEKGISLLHIFENEWNSLVKREIWKSIIKGKLNLHQKIGARKCELREVTKAESSEFLESNHLQGNLGSRIALGLYFEDELVNLMTFGKNRMGNKDNVEWELLRFASKSNTSVQGGASKLFKHFVKEYSEGKGIVSYSDRRYSQGNMYNKLGFKFSHFSAPNYFYFKSGLKLESRQKYMKHKLEDLLETFDSTLTEWENMKANKFNRIWDCGNGVWVFNNKYQTSCELRGNLLCR